MVPLPSMLLTCSYLFPGTFTPSVSNLLGCAPHYQYIVGGDSGPGYMSCGDSCPHAVSAVDPSTVYLQLFEVLLLDH